MGRNTEGFSLCNLFRARNFCAPFPPILFATAAIFHGVLKFLLGEVFFDGYICISGFGKHRETWVRQTLILFYGGVFWGCLSFEDLKKFWQPFCFRGLPFWIFRLFTEIFKYDFRLLGSAFCWWVDKYLFNLSEDIDVFLGGTFLIIRITVIFIWGVFTVYVKVFRVC